MPEHKAYKEAHASTTEANYQVYAYGRWKPFFV